ncbi:MAG: GIY-YIG nuclease family protein [Mesorhizobium sp.]|nr:MAG: GIY-YIG nuclease family protein [Mesorhizobium sp.]
MTGYVYITASQKHGTIYIDVTNDLGRRVPEHKAGQGSSFTSRYGVQRQWKIELIETTNPEWFEPFVELGGRRSVSCTAGA